MSPATRYRPLRAGALERRARINRLNLTTPLGLAIARFGGARLRPGPDGLLLAEGYRPRFPVAGAFTIGNVVTTKGTFEALAEAIPDVMAHESRHASQYSKLGLAFLPAYGLAASWSWLRSGDLALRNVFEKNAGLVSGGYVRPGVVPAGRPASALVTSWLRRARRG